MKKYYYYVDNITKICINDCMVWNEIGLGLERKIGSVRCKRCYFCEGFDNEENWIKCNKLEDAIGELKNMK